MGQGYQQILQDHYDDLTGSNQTGGRSTSDKLRPFPFVKRDDEVALLEWLQNTIDALEDEQYARAINQVNNVNFYHGLQRLATDSSLMAVNWGGKRFARQAEFVMNHARDFVHQKEARLMRYSPNIAVSPVNNEYEDRLGARLGKRISDNIFLINDAEDVFRAMVKEAAICGESFLFPVWNNYAGDKDPAIEGKLRELEQRARATGKPFTQDSVMFENSRGEVVPIQNVKRVGEVDWVQPLPWFVLHEPKFRWRDVNYIFRFEIKHIDEIKAENPGIDLSAARSLSVYSSTLPGKPLGPSFVYGEYVLQYHMYHRAQPFLDSGWYCKFIPGVVLKSEPSPFSYKGLPVARFTDWDDPMNAHGISFFEDLKPPLVLQNKMLGLMYRNIAIANHPKLLVPEGAANIQSMANGPLVVEYTYPMKPEILAFNSNGQDIFAVSEKFMQQTTQLSGTFDVSRGGTIPNARAASILNFYEEQEEQRESSQIKKFTKCIEKTARLSLGIAGDNYRDDDGRTVRVVGARNRYKLRKLENVARLSGPYDIKVERTTALSESKQGRIDQIVQLSTVPLSTSQGDALKPGLFTREQVLRMLEVADTPTFFEMAVAAVEKQESENEDMFEGIPVDAPQPWEAHEVCWNVLFQFMQSREFLDTKGLPAAVREAVLEHMAAHELFMYKKAQMSLAYAQDLATNLNWPAVFVVGPGAKPPFDMTVNQLVQMHMAPPPIPPPVPAVPPLMGMGGDIPPPEGAPDDMSPEPMEEGEDLTPDKKARRDKRDPISLDLNINIKKGASKRKLKIGPVNEAGHREVEVSDDTLSNGAIDV